MFQLNISHALTVLRILLVPVVVVALLDETPNGDAIVAGVFGVGGADRHCSTVTSRAAGAITTVGTLMDPIADKLLVAAALISLVSLNLLPAWIAIVIIAREFAVTGAADGRGGAGVVIQASWMGKVKTILQVAAIICLIAVNPAPLWVNLLVYAAVAATVISGFDDSLDFGG